MTAVVGTHALSDADTLAIIAYLRQSPAVKHETPEFKPTILMALFVGAGLIPMDVPVTVNVVSAPLRAATAEYGEYVLTYMDCTSCHGKNLDGVVPPPYPPAPDIRNYSSTWSKDDFFNVIHAYAASAQPGDAMPWKDISRMDDVELEALYLYLHEATSK
jgi:cytochrome c553